MIKVDICIDLKKGCIGVDLLKREDATDEEWKVAKDIEDLMFTLLEPLARKIEIIPEAPHE